MRQMEMHGADRLVEMQNFNFRFSGEIGRWQMMIKKKKYSGHDVSNALRNINALCKIHQINDIMAHLGAPNNKFDRLRRGEIRAIDCVEG